MVRSLISETFYSRYIYEEFVRLSVVKMFASGHFFLHLRVE